ncbi:SLBB domain-containing protein [Chloroflexota bacterium]
MSTPIVNKFWLFTTVLLIIVIFTSSIIIWSKYRPGEPVEISVLPPDDFNGEIYIDGAVHNPGFYQLKNQDTIADIIRAAGGVTAGADIAHAELNIPDNASQNQYQKVDINTAELMKVDGIGTTIYENLKYLITVAE